MFACHLALAVAATVASAADIAAPDGLRFRSAGGLTVGPDGDLHMVAWKAPLGGGSLLDRFLSTSSAPTIVYARESDGVWTTEVPAPPQHLESWQSAAIVDAAIAVDDDGRVALILSEDLSESDGLQSHMYIAVRAPDGAWSTRELPAYAGRHEEMQVAFYGGKWTVAAQFVIGNTAKKTWTGVVRWDEDADDVARWTQSGQLTANVRLLDADTPTLLFREAGKAKVVAEDGTITSVEGRLWHQVSGVVDDGTVHILAHDPKLNSAVVGTLGGPLTPIGTAESGWHNDMALSADGQPLAVWYYRRNAFNKGLKMGKLSESGEWESFTLLRSSDENIGWEPDLVVGPSGELTIGAQNTSTGRPEFRRYASFDEARSAAVPDRGDWTDAHRDTTLLAYGGGWFNEWTGDSLAPQRGDDLVYGEGVQPLEGELTLAPGVATEGGFAGKIGRVDLGLEFMDRRSDAGGGLTNKVQNLMGRVGFGHFPRRGATTSVHLRSSSQSGVFRASSGESRSVEMSDKQFELRYAGKGRTYFGIRYRQWNAPQELYLVQGGEQATVTGAVDAAGDFSTGQIIGGWSVLDYISHYEVQRLRPYIDGSAGVGPAQADFKSVGGGPSYAANGFTLSGQLDVGMVAYKRLHKYRGAGGFGRLGLRADLQYAARLPEDKGETTTYARVDQRVGPYINAGVLF